MNCRHYRRKISERKHPRLISMKDCQDTRYEDFHLSTSIWNKNIKFNTSLGRIENGFSLPILLDCKQPKFVQGQQNEKNLIIKNKKVF